MEYPSDFVQYVCAAFPKDSGLQQHLVVGDPVLMVAKALMEARLYYLELEVQATEYWVILNNLEPAPHIQKAIAELQKLLAGLEVKEKECVHALTWLMRIQAFDELEIGGLDTIDENGANRVMRIQ